MSSHLFLRVALSGVDWETTAAQSYSFEGELTKKGRYLRYTTVRLSDAD
jgi:hypothetical protein